MELRKLQLSVNIFTIRNQLEMDDTFVIPPDKQHDFFKSFSFNEKKCCLSNVERIL